jgi:hypothetical protein
MQGKNKTQRLKHKLQKHLNYVALVFGTGNGGDGDGSPGQLERTPKIFRGRWVGDGNIYIYIYIYQKILKFTINICSCFKLVSISSYYTIQYYAQPLHFPILKKLDQFKKGSSDISLLDARQEKNAV